MMNNTFQTVVSRASDSVPLLLQGKEEKCKEFASNEELRYSRKKARPCSLFRPLACPGVQHLCPFKGLTT